MIIVLVAITLALLIFIIWLNKPSNYHVNSLNEIVKYIDGLLDQGSDGSILIITHKKSKHFIQFAKYIIDNNLINLHYGFPDAPWSREFFSKIESEFKKQNIEYKIVHTSENNVPRFLDVDFINDSGLGLKIATLSFNVMGLRIDDHYVVRYKGEPSKEEVNRSLKRKIEELKSNK